MQDLRKARLIQEHLLPTDVEVAGLDVAAHCEPCRWVAGDYVDVAPLVDGRTLLLVADVSGKGLQAALVASSMHSLVHTCLDDGRGLVELVDRLNAYLCRYLPDESFVTMACVAIDPQTGDTEGINAGHPPAMVVDRGGARRPLRSGKTLPLGIDSLAIATEPDRIAGDDLLALFSDGLTETFSPSGKMLRLDGLSDCLASVYGSANGASLCEVASRVKAQLDRFRAGTAPGDDCALALARRRNGKG